MQKTNINLGGVTRVPDDTMCPNGDLALALNLAADGDGLKMLEKPMPMFQLRQGETVLCVHQNDGYKHYITSYDGKLWWGTAPVSLLTPPPVWSPTELGASDATQATVMGNTVITQGSKMEYWLLDEGGGTYKNLGQRPPMMSLQFGLDSQMLQYPPSDSDPIEFWDWRYSQDVPLPYCAASENVHATKGRMDGSAVPDKADAAGSIEAVLIDTFPNLWDFSLEHASGTSNESESKISDFVDKLTDLSLAWVNKFITNKATTENKFVFPFFIRYCYEMYDGSQIMQSDPVLLLPATHAPQFVIKDGHLKLKAFDYEPITEDGQPAGYKEKDHAKVAVWIKGRIFGVVSTLVYRLSLQAADYESWRDLIKSVGIYVTAPIYTYDQSGKVYGWKEVTDHWANHFSEGDFHDSDIGAGRKSFDEIFSVTTASSSEYDSYANHFVLKIPEHDNADIRKAALNAGQYFKIADLDYGELLDTYVPGGGSSSGALSIDNHALETLTTRRQLVEEYASGDTLQAEAQYVYNRRLHIANVSRTLRPPLDPGLQVCWLNKTPSYECNETIVISDDGQHVLHTDGTLPVWASHPLPLWLYHGNRNARDLYLDWLPDNRVYKYKLTDHPTLNGAYWMSGLLWSDDTSYVGGEGVQVAASDIPTPTGGTITTEGEVWTSNAENPFVFQAGNVNQVGDGKVLALRAAVAPLAEDQHGYAPMYAFTSQGIWAMTHSKDGTPAAIDHICGDIITEGTEPLNLPQSCLVMTARGLLELSGRSVRNLSAKIDGEFAVTDIAHYDGAQGLVGMVWPLLPDVVDNFKAPLRGQSCRMSYDYSHQRVYVWLAHGGWVLNLRTGAWTQTAQTCQQSFNAYPDCEFVSGDAINTGSSMVAFYGVMGMYSRDRHDTALLTTRPIKLSEHLAKLREVAVRGFVNTDLQGTDAQVWTVVHGSRNWHDYGLVGDNQGDRVTRLGGSGYRSHVVSVLLRDPAASVDRIVLTADEEQGNRLR